jgi:hypothetical protein
MNMKVIVVCKIMKKVFGKINVRLEYIFSCLIIVNKEKSAERRLSVTVHVGMNGALCFCVT